MVDYSLSLAGYSQHVWPVNPEVLMDHSSVNSVLANNGMGHIPKFLIDRIYILFQVAICFALCQKNSTFL